MESFKDAARSNTGLLAAVEKRALIWLAARLPEAVGSDHLTALGLFAMLMVGASFALSSRLPIMLWWAVFWLSVNWFGDSLDGTVARVRQQLRPRYGFYIDHILDSFGALFVLGGLALSGRMTPLIASAVLIAYFLLSIEIYLATYCVGRFEMSHWGLGPTELRIVLAVGALMLLVKPLVTIAGVHVPLFDAGGIVAAAGMLLTAIVAMIRHIRTLYLAEPLTTRLTPCAASVAGPAVQVFHDVPDHALRIAKEH
jgi:archaetidylinositol phosphate synthase